MKKFILVMALFGFVTVLFLLHVPEASAGPCGPCSVWVPGQTTPDGVWVKGYCRPAKRAGFVWVAGYHSARNVWVRGFWRPLGPPHPRKVWVPGHRNLRGRWVPGHYR